MSKTSESTAPSRVPGMNGVDLRRTPLAQLVSAHLQLKGMRQVDFCRETGFDQGLLSKILSSVVSTLNIESALKLADGLNLPPSAVFEAIGRKEIDEWLRRFYSQAELGTPQS